ncbi:hypothetical protein RhiirC2_781665 [Rhizophagus irregularis]|uniref:Uncharacterized protein n=1 Tax=Rhizophagus irregularis TaxID=588596 RepID=A0A2N1N4U6_9GLOM|nr:hypothetical protein RhiirC2_781665 [Rhizophagus irregularis]
MSEENICDRCYKFNFYFGTTYSEFAYAHKSNPSEITAHNDWKQYSGYYKIPTVLNKIEDKPPLPDGLSYKVAISQYLEEMSKLIRKLVGQILNFQSL